MRSFFVEVYIMYKKISYEKSVEFINSFTKSGAPVTDLSRFRKLCAQLGDPQNKLKFLHIAGTNGKGSVSEYLAVALEKAGYKTGKFTSPFIVNLRERIQLNGENIPPELFAECSAPVIEAVGDRTDYSQFEIFTAIAFLFFNRVSADFVVLETGIGGLNDCTNIVTPVLSLITKIDYDHCSILGNTIPEIAAHKAGIIKPNIPVFVTPFQLPETLRVIREKAAQKNSPCIIADEKTLIVNKNSLFGTEFSYKGEFFATKMGGAHQPENASAVIDALRFLNVPEQSIHSALSEASLPARMQVFKKEPLVIIDGGHNASGAAAAASLLRADGVKPVMILGMLNTKDWGASLEILLKEASAAFFVDDFYPTAVPAEELTAFANKLGVKSEPSKTLTAALVGINETCPNSPIFVGGSLYLAGEAYRVLAKNDG